MVGDGGEGVMLEAWGYGRLGFFAAFVLPQLLLMQPTSIDPFTQLMKIRCFTDIHEIGTRRLQKDVLNWGFIKKLYELLHSQQPTWLEPSRKPFLGGCSQGVE